MMLCTLWPSVDMYKSHYTTACRNRRCFVNFTVNAI